MFCVDSERPAVAIAAFTHGSFNLKKRRKIKFDSFKQNDCDGKNNNRFLVARTDTCCYVGKNFGDNFSSSKMCSNYVGIFNKSTGKIQICDADLFYLNPHFPDAERKQKEETRNLTKYEKQIRLIDTFGGTVSKKKMEIHHHNIIEKEATTKAMSDALKDKKTDDSQTPSNAEQIDIPELLPPCNIHATTPNEVYQIKDLLDSVDMRHLSPFSKTMLHLTHDEISTLARQEKYCQFVLGHLMNLPEEPIARQKIVNCLKYFQYLVTLYKMTAQELKKMDFFTLFPEFIRQKFMHSFIANSNDYKGLVVRSMSVYQKDKVAIYLIILALILDDFKTPFKQFALDLKIGHVKLAKLFGYVGAKIVQEKGKRDLMRRSAVLRVPLELKIILRKKMINK